MSIAELPPRAIPLPTEGQQFAEPERPRAPTIEQLAYLGLFILALLMHFWGLGDRALHHDETLHAAFSWRLFRGEGFIHDPLLHGPFLYYVGALFFFLFGDTNYTARIGVALFGSVLVVMPYLLRRELGRGAALLASFYLLISPAFLYVGRFVRHDAYGILFELLTFICIVRYTNTRQNRWLYIGAGALGLMAANMETFYLYVAIFLPVVVLALLWRVWKQGIAVAAALGIAIIALVFVLPGHPERPFPTSDTVVRLNGNYICPSAAQPFPPDNPMRIAKPGPLLGLPPLPTFDNQYALCVRNAPENDFGLYFIKIGQFFGHPAILLAMGLTLATLTASYRLIWRRRPDGDGLTRWEQARSSYDGILDAFASLAHGRRILIAIGVFLLAYGLLFTSFLTNPTGIVSGAAGSLLYWLAQHEVERGNQPGYYYMVLLAIYEPLALMWGACGSLMVAVMLWRRVRAWRTNQIEQHTNGSASVDWNFGLPLLLVWWSLATLLIYSWAGEKMPWLTVHVALPLTLLGAWAVGRVLIWWYGTGTLIPGTISMSDDPFDAEEPDYHSLAVYMAAFVSIITLSFILITFVAKPDSPLIGYTPWVPVIASLLIGLLTIGTGIVRGWRWAIGTLALALTLTGTLYEMRSTYQLNYRWGDVPREMMIYTQTSPDVARMMARLEEAALRRGGGLNLPVWYDNETVWKWYFRRFSNAREQPPRFPAAPGDEVMAVMMLYENYTDPQYPQNRDFLEQMRVQRYPLRWWFPEDQIYRLPSNWASTPVRENSPLLMRVLRQPFDGRTSAEFWQYILFRQLQTPLGSSDFVVAVRPELAFELGLGTGGENNER